MKHFTWILLLLLSIILVGCVPKENNIDDKPEPEITYNYTYDLTLENYAKYIVFRYRHLDIVDGNKQLEVFFETKYPNGIMVDIEATVFLQTEYTIFETIIQNAEFPISFTNLDQASKVLNYTGFQNFRLVAVTEITGKVMTNDETVALEEQVSLNAKHSLEQMLEKFKEPYETLSTESYLHVTEGGQTQISSVKTAYRTDPFYYETLYSDFSGALWMENSHGDIDAYYLSHRHFDYYLQKLMVIPIEDLNKVVDDGLFELDDSWTYSIENGDFVVTGSSESLLDVVLFDEQTLNQYQNLLGNGTIEITFADLDTRLMVSIELWVGLSKVKIETYYSFNTFASIDLSMYRVLPTTNPELANQPTDLSQTQSGYLLQNVRYYYQIEVTEGTYVFDLSYPVEIEVFDLSGNLIEPETWLTPMVSDKKYRLESGFYMVNMFHSRNSTIDYSISLNHLENIYETIGSPTDEIELVDGFNLHIEGKFDEVYLYYEALKDGYIVLYHPDNEPLEVIYVYNEMLGNQVTYTIYGEVPIQVVAGINRIKITAPEAVNTIVQIRVDE